MGNCPSSFRAQFKPNHNNATKCQTDIILSPVVDKDGDKSHESIEERSDCDAEAVEIIGHNNITNGTPGTAAEVSESHTPLKVHEVNLCITENTEKHHTCDFNTTRRTPSLILRRGFPFRLHVILNRTYEHEKDILCFVFTVKDETSPSYTQDTQVVVPLQTEEDVLTTDLWQARIILSDDKAVTVEIMSSSSSIIGEWIIEVDTRPKNDLGTNGFHYRVKEPMILLFNSWCEGDTVYLSKPELCEEYVMSDSGLIWRGTHSRLKPSFWNYAQFEENVLECCLYLLTHVGTFPIVARADPILVVKHLSEAVNYRGDTGLLIGNWSGNYKGGLPPTSWCGSQQILQSFYKCKKPVKYGQCWVYAGVLTTALRALGIPSRPVTNYLSARNTQASMTVDFVFGHEDKLLEKRNASSVWSFHVWTEAWMQRPDLELGGCYDGWQVVDVASHENRYGSGQSGPASVVAIKRGEVKKPFDTSIVLAEVRAEKAYWRHLGLDQPLKLMKISTEQVGLCISTKAVGNFERVDITHEYKEMDCDMNLRNSMLRSLIDNKSSLTRYCVNDDFQDVLFHFSIPDDVTIGETFAVKLKASNKSENKSYSVRINLRTDTALYTGQIMQLVKKDGFEIELSPGVEQEMTMNVHYSGYAKALYDQCLFSVCASAHVMETGFDFCVHEDFRVRMPHIDLQVEGEISQNQPLVITAFFTNPLPIPLKKGIFTIEGTSLEKPLTQKLKGRVEPKADAIINFKVTPKYSGMRSVVVKFHSKELQDVEGYHMLNVRSGDVSEKESNSHL